MGRPKIISRAERGTDVLPYFARKIKEITKNHEKFVFVVSTLSYHRFSRDIAKRYHVFGGTTFGIALQNMRSFGLEKLKGIFCLMKYF